jgi:CheY-like chemotaxis protein
MINTYLLVDDDDIFNFLHREVILQVDPTAKIETYESSIDAIAFLIQRADRGEPMPNYVFIDIRMPELNGFAMLDQMIALFSEETFKHSRIFMLSSSLDEKDTARAKSYHMVKAFKGKPLTQEIVGELLAK